MPCDIRKLIEPELVCELDLKSVLGRIYLNEGSTALALVELSPTDAEAMFSAQVIATVRSLEYKEFLANNVGRKFRLTLTALDPNDVNLPAD